MFLSEEAFLSPVVDLLELFAEVDDLLMYADCVFKDGFVFCRFWGWGLSVG